MDRFLRIERLLGPERFARLTRSMVTIAGLGAVGGYVMEGLARAGIGRIRVIDFDLIQQDNINRQILALESTVGMSKAQAARQRVLQINPHCRVEALELFIDSDSMEKVLSPKPDLVIDAIDSLGPKVSLLAACVSEEIEVISSMGAALRTDPSLVRCGDLMQTKNCPLARRVRRELRKRGVGEGITCVYSTESVDFSYVDPEEETVRDDALPEHGRGRKRRVLGSLPTLTGIFGLTIANLAIKKLSTLP
ncbi:MAG: tRNA threonylcarbamoyladenosine dehydratase [Proteobacteria bacterium]|nr:tRNA threonylcarbamoyladenosine dehydratase [Pseudomonadota bacterium]MBU1687238.1 tRNA threonylcarbamoyladenosine dehydratase [Pseudomonadota bacterium]